MSIGCGKKGRLAADADILVDAFDGALRKLEVDRTDPAALVVAKHLISVARAGERDPVRLRDLTVKGVRIEWRRLQAAIPGRALRSLVTSFLANPFL